MNNKIHHNHPVIKRIYFYIFLVTYLVFIIILIFFYSQAQNQQTSNQAAAPAPAMMAKTEGSLVLASATAGNSYKVGQNITVNAVADSQAKDIVSFDVLLSYDQAALTLVSATSPLTGFQVISAKNPNPDHVSMTVIKAPQVQTPSVFSNTPVLQLVFTAKTPGTYNLSILPTAGKEKTDFADINTNIMRPKTGNLTITVY